MSNANIVPVAHFTGVLDAMAWDRAGTGNDMLRLSLRIVDEGAWQGRHVPFSCTFTPHTLDMCERVLRALGWNGVDRLGSLTIAKLQNRVRIETEHEVGKADRNGETKTFARVKFINALLKVFDPLSGADLDALDERFMRGLGRERRAERDPRASSAASPSSEMPPGRFDDYDDADFEVLDPKAPPAAATA